MLWFGGIGSNGGSKSGILKSVVRHFSKKRAQNLRKINPKVPFPEASTIAQNLYQLIKEKGPLSVPNTWNCVKESGGISGLNSKTHMRIMLHWMRGRKMVKLLVNHIGSSKKFLVTTLPEEPDLSPSIPKGLKLETEKKPSVKKVKQHQ